MARFNPRFVVFATQAGDSAQLLAGRPRRLPSLRVTLFAVVLLALAGLVGFAALREATAVPSPRSNPVIPTRPARTPAEDAYAQALWPIHAQVERAIVRMSLAQIFYKIQDMDRATLQSRLDQALAVYRDAEQQLAQLQPPPSLQASHESYLTAVRLLEASTTEALKMFGDGDDAHLLAAYPLSQEASNRIREVGTKLWPSEFPPH